VTRKPIGVAATWLTVELDAEALMAERQQMLDCRERRRLDDVDHDRRCQHRDPAGTDEWCGMFGATLI